jgi:hypothetical protein
METLVARIGQLGTKPVGKLALRLVILVMQTILNPSLRGVAIVRVIFVKSLPRLI